VGEAMVIEAWHYDTLMQELMHKSRGDFKSYLRGDTIRHPYGALSNRTETLSIRCDTIYLRVLKS